MTFQPAPVSVLPAIPAEIPAHYLHPQVWTPYAPFQRMAPMFVPVGHPYGYSFDPNSRQWVPPPPPEVTTSPPEVTTSPPQVTTSPPEVTEDSLHGAEAALLLMSECPLQDLAFSPVELDLELDLDSI